MIAIQTTVDRRAMTALAKMARKTLRRGRNGPVRMLAWFVVAVEGLLVYATLRAGGEGWLVNALLGVFMLGCILGEDTVNGLVGLRQVAPGSREVNAAFQEKYYVHRTQGAETWWNYDQIRAVAETEDYFALLLGKSQGQVYDKKGFSWGTPEDFRTLIQQKTGLRVQKVR